MPTIVFDEIDTGVSGEIADRMADIMQEMGEQDRQVISITQMCIRDRLTGITESALYTYVCFYRGHLLMAPDVVSLTAYIDAMAVSYTHLAGR